MKPLILVGLVLSAIAAYGQSASSPTHKEYAVPHRYIIERTFKPGALNNLDAAVKSRVNTNNDKYGVRWLLSYANASRTKTYCVYEGPSEKAIREAARANGMSVDRIMGVPVTILPR